MNKKVIFSVLFVLCMYCAVFWGIRWIISDEPLSNEAQQLLDNVQLYDPNLIEHPYFEVLGFDARSDISPNQLGRLSYHYGWKDYYIDSIHSSELKSKKVPFDPLYSEYFKQEDKQFLLYLINPKVEQDLYQLILKNQEKLQKLYRQQAVLKFRFQRFLKTPKISKPLFLTSKNKYPNYSLILMMHQLHLSNLVLNNNQKEIADYIEILIIRIGNAENLVEKLVVKKMISDSVEVLNELNIQNPSSDIQISNLNQNQKSLLTSLSIEFVSLKQSIENMGSTLVKNKQESMFFHFFYPVLYYENMTLNREASIVSKYIHYSMLNNHDLKKELNKPIIVDLEVKSIKNILGQKFTLTDPFKWQEYNVSIRLLEQRIKVFNVLLGNRKFDLEQLNLNDEGYEYYRTETELCIKSPDPYQDKEQWEQYKSCLKI